VSSAVPGIGVRAGAGSGRAFPAVLGIGALLVAGYYLLPAGAAQDYGYAGIGVTSTAVMALAVLRRRPAERLGWWLLTAANALFVAGDGVYDVYDLVLHRDAPFPSVADALYLAGYPLLFAGVARVTQARSAAGGREARADAAMVCLGALALSWHLLMGDYAHDGSLNAFGKVVTLAYPVMDLGVLFIVVSSMMVRAARRPADTLLGVAVAVMLAADFVYDLQILHDTYTAGGPVDGLFLANYVLIAAAAVHPSVARPLPTATTQPRRRAWLPFIALASMVSPALLLTCSLLHLHVDVPVLAGVSIAMATVAAVRTSFLIARLRRQTHELSAQGESLRTALVGQRRLEADLRHQAFHDTLTGLANRALLHDRIEHALSASARRPGTVALCFCDLDGFKAVNDGLGHQAGDRLLAVASKRIASVVRAGDTVARLGGDEFAVLLTDVGDPEVVTALAERMVSVLRQPVLVDGHRVYVSASVGVAFADAQSTTERLLAEADAAMYEAKQDGKDRVAMFETHMRERLLERMQLANALPTSLREGRFRLQFQPQLLLADGRLEGFEALLRWDHPTLGPVEPDRFIPIAEETGFIVKLGRWVLREACAEAARWLRDGNPVPVSVNVSGRQLQDTSLSGDVHEALAATGLPAHLLILEITETVLMKDPHSIAETLADLRRIGVRIAIDDFGTGYSSLATLRHVPADILKIDKSFIDPLADPASEASAFVQAILRLAGDLHLEATAEGIEHQSQRDALVGLDCHSGQGYLMSRPLDAEAARSFLLATDAVGARDGLEPTSAG
jgi:diguanylate cyclase